MKELLAVAKTVNIKLLGDSITHGAGGTGYKQEGDRIVGDFRRNPNGYCWAKLFKEYMESKYDCKVTNNGCSGTTIEYTIEHFDELVNDEDDIIICTIGTNNRHKFFCEVETRPTKEQLIETFYDNVVTLNKKFVEAGKKVFFVANIPASVDNETKDGENYWRIIKMSDINDIYKRAQKECGFRLISLYDLFLEYCAKEEIQYETLLCDGLHPNDNGYKIMYELLIKALGVYDDRKNVMLLGDSIRRGYDEAVRKTLSGVANVYFPMENCRFAAYLLRNLHEYGALCEGCEKIDVLHWNAGLWDCLRLFEEDPHTPVEFYKYYVDRICVRIKKLFPNAKVIFATSTSVQSEKMGVNFKRYNEEIEAYNDAAVEIVKKHGFEVNDLYALSCTLPENAHSDPVHYYTPVGTKAFTDKVLTYLADALGLDSIPEYKEELYTDKPVGI